MLGLGDGPDGDGDAGAVDVVEPALLEDVLAGADAGGPTCVALGVGGAAVLTGAVGVAVGVGGLDVLGTAGPGWWVADRLGSGRTRK